MPVISRSVRRAQSSVRSASVTYALEPRRKVLEVDWLLDKEKVLDPESVLIAFPFNLGEPSFRFDLSGVPSAPHDDQIPGAVRDYFPIQRWAAVSDGERGVVMASIENHSCREGCCGVLMSMLRGTVNPGKRSRWEAGRTEPPW